MTSDELKAWARRCGLSTDIQAAAAMRIGVSTYTPQRWPGMSVANEGLTKNWEPALNTGEIDCLAFRLPALAAGVFSCPRRPMAHPGRPRKSGARHPNGRLRWAPSIDHGHELTLAHRAAIIAGADPRDARAGYPLGILAMLGHLADPGVGEKEAEEQTYLRHQAGLRYAAYRMGAWAGSGRPNPSPRSHLASFALAAGGDETFLYLDEMDPDARQRKCEKREREARAHVLVYGLFPMFVLEDIAADEHRMRFMDASGGRPTEADRFAFAALRQALGALVRDYRPDPQHKRGGMRLVPTAPA